MHARNVVIVGPYRHHRVEIGFLERFVERRFGVLWRGEHRAFHYYGLLILSNPIRCQTWSGVSCLMQLEWPSGHSRSKHGLHGRSSLTMPARVLSGGVNAGLLEPEIAVSGLPSE